MADLHYPFASHTVHLSADRMHSVDEGTGDVVLPVHGTPTWSFEWRHVIAALRSFLASSSGELSER